MKIVVIGGGMVGLCSAMLLAGDGHEVVVLERDPDPAPDPSAAWDRWERKGVNQFRLAHFYLARFRQVVESELPGLGDALMAAGALRYSIVGNIPDQMTGGPRDGDAQLDVITGRRATVEAVTSRVAEDTPGVTIRRGTPVDGLVTGTSVRPGVPHVAGVALANGEQIGADLIVDAGGRRSALPGWLEAVLARLPGQETDDSGFIYFGRHFRSPDGTLPPMFGPLRQTYSSLSCLTLPADNGTWSVTLTTSSKDRAMRAVADAGKWAAVVKLLPLAAHWLDGEPIDSGVAVMAKIEDRIRDYAPEGHPVATGVLAVGDAWSCTNPSLGRGSSLAIVHAVLLRDLLRRSGDLDPWQQSVQWADTTRETVEPWFRTTRRYDRHRLGQLDADIEGRRYETDDEEWRLLQGLEAHALADGDFLRANIRINMVLQLPGDAFADTSLTQRLESEIASAAGQPPLGPTRAALLAALEG